MLFRFEIKKVVKKKMTFILLAVLLLLVGILFYFYQMQNRNQATFQIEMQQENIRSIKAAITETREDPVKSSKKNEVLQEYKRELELAEDILDAIQKKDTKRELFYQIKEKENLLQDLKKGNTYTSDPVWKIKQDLAVQKAVYQKGYAFNEIGYATDGYSFSRDILKLFFPYIFIFFVLLMASSVIGGDIEKQKLRFYWALPVKRTNFMINKILVVLLISLVSLILIITAAFLLGKVGGSKGYFDYPVLVRLVQNNFKLIDMGEFITQLFVLSIFVIFFLIVLFYTLMLLCKNSFIVIPIILGLIFLTNYLNESAKNLNGLLVILNPFSYINITKIIDGSLAAQIGQEINWVVGIIILLFYTILFFLLSAPLLKKERLI
ncbi:ABC transporter permease subunit [Listeria aquatica]|uniref:ABC transporter permease subunit n=1 Tax=Listeria aquatica TaxID=1494960 RepID=UPI0031F551CF